MDSQEGLLPLAIFYELGKDPEEIRPGLSIAKTIAGNYWLSIRENDQYSLLDLWATREQAENGKGLPYFSLKSGISCGTNLTDLFKVGDEVVHATEFDVPTAINVQSDVAAIVFNIIAAAIHFGNRQEAASPSEPATFPDILFQSRNRPN
ncbi:MAG: hypothetical protein WCW17_02755 [Patescibacteria group bacterium]|jgi:hypothetical protein